MDKHELHLGDLTRGLFFAQQPVPRAGYHWVDKLCIDPDPCGELIEEHDGPWLVEAPSDGTSPWGHRRPLLTMSDAHRQFARLRTPNDIIRFAKRYGTLRKERKDFAYLTYVDGTPHIQKVDRQVVEHLSFWEDEIAQMDMLIKLWDLAKRGERDRLQHFIKWEQSPRRVYIRCNYLFERRRRLAPYYDTSWKVSNTPVYPVSGQVMTEDTPVGREILSRFKGDDVLDPIRWYVKIEVNKRLKGHVNPVVLIPRDALYFEPDSLLAALYSLFVLELSGQDKPHILCARPGCGLYVTVERKSKRYCSDACRKLAAYYRNQERMRGATAEVQAAGTEE